MLCNKWGAQLVQVVFVGPAAAILADSMFPDAQVRQFLSASKDLVRPLIGRWKD